jgi:hypothetical protein
MHIQTHMEQEEEVRGRASAAEAPRHMSARPFAQEAEQAPRQELRPSPALNKAAQVLCARNRRCGRRGLQGLVGGACKRRKEV